MANQWVYGGTPEGGMAIIEYPSRIVDASVANQRVFGLSLHQRFERPEIDRVHFLTIPLFLLCLQIHGMSGKA